MENSLMDSTLLTIKERINVSIKDALLKRDADKANTLRFLNSLIQNREIEKRGTGQAPALADDEIIEIFQREVKKRKEAIELFRKGNRPDLAEKETKELVFINEYLPPEMSRDEITALIKGLKDKGFGDFSSMMKEAVKSTRGRADGKVVSEIVKEILK